MRGSNNPLLVQNRPAAEKHLVDLEPDDKRPVRTSCSSIDDTLDHKARARVGHSIVADQSRWKETVWRVGNREVFC